MPKTYEQDVQEIIGRTNGKGYLSPSAVFGHDFEAPDYTSDSTWTPVAKMEKRHSDGQEVVIEMRNGCYRLSAQVDTDSCGGRLPSWEIGYGGLLLLLMLTAISAVHGYSPQYESTSSAT